MPKPDTEAGYARREPGVESYFVADNKNKAAVLTEVILILAAVFWDLNFAATKYALGVSVSDHHYGGRLRYRPRRVLRVEKVVGGGSSFSGCIWPGVSEDAAVPFSASCAYFEA
jgi:hypothetical protein